MLRSTYDRQCALSIDIGIESMPALIRFDLACFLRQDLGATSTEIGCDYALHEGYSYGHGFLDARYGVGNLWNPAGASFMKRMTLQFPCAASYES